MELAKKSTNLNTQKNLKEKFLKVYNPTNCMTFAGKMVTVADAINAKTPTIGSFVRNVNKGFTEKLIMAWLLYLNNILNLNKPMSEEQIRLCSNMIVVEFYMLKISDLTLLFKRIISGSYGAFYERLGIDKVLDFFRQYLEERYQEAAQMSQQVHNDRQSDDTFNYSNNIRRKYYLKKK